MTDSQTLLSQAQCYLCLGVSLAEALELALLAQIANGTISGGTSGGLTGTGSPQNVVSAPAGTTYWDSAGQSLWVKNSGTNNTGWVQVTA